jgi:hypothetical protein
MFTGKRTDANTGVGRELKHFVIVEHRRRWGEVLDESYIITKQRGRSSDNNQASVTSYPWNAQELFANPGFRLQIPGLENSPIGFKTVPKDIFWAPEGHKPR